MTIPRHASQGVDVLLVRPYEKSDRPAVRKMVLTCLDPRVSPRCLQTRPELLADVMTRYYTDIEPASCWVAEISAGDIVGCLLGCLSTRRRWFGMALRIMPAVILRSLGCGALWMCPTLRLLHAGWSTWRSSRHAKSAHHPIYPAHLHICVLEPWRHKGLATSLVKRFLAQADRRGVQGVHVSVMEGNRPARQLFRALGFQEVGHYQTLLPGTWSHVKMLLLGARLGNQGHGRGSR